MNLEQFQALPVLEVAGDLSIITGLLESVNLDTISEAQKNRLANVAVKMSLGTVLHPVLSTMTNDQMLNLILDKYDPVEGTEVAPAQTAE